MQYTVAVRELCAFTAKQGDLDLRFTPAPTALEGITGHGVVAARRGENYQSELALSGSYQHLRVRGRADGFDPVAGRLDEVKTFKGHLDRQPPSHRALHWAQAKVYAWLLCDQQQRATLDVALVYYDIGTQKETVFTEHYTASALQQHFEDQCARFLAWAEQQMAHRAARDAALGTLGFAFGNFREGQRPLAEAVYKAAVAARCLLAQAPTGIGKTMGTIFPLLKAMPGQGTGQETGRGLDKVFFLTAKTSGRQVALDALAHIGPATPLRVLEMMARDKACEHPDKACHGASCPLAQGFYDRLPAARAAAVAHPAQSSVVLDQARVRDVALQYQVCPYYLSQELARWADVVVGDYNYYFDLGGLLHGLTQANQWRVGLLVDEAHNLLDRSRRMYSAELLPDALFHARKSTTASSFPKVKKALDKVRRCWVALDKAQATAYAVYDDFPDSLLVALQQCTSTLTDHLSDHAELPTDAALQRFYFDAQHLLRLAELLDTHSFVDATQPSTPSAPSKPGSSTLCIRNLVPAPFTGPRLEAAHTSTLFSATLQPAHFHADLLGLPNDHLWVDVASPFQAAQLNVQVARHISTRYAHRQASLAPIVALVAQQFAQQPGNYLAFFSSYDYLQQAADLFEQQHPQVPCWRQSRRMLEAEQRAFLARFTEGGQGIGFAVLGGAFAEGIDLPGSRLIGAFLATLGLPQINPVNEHVRERMELLFGAGRGYDYTYLYPGLQKVVQAADRVIRTPQDQGVVHLMDDRFARGEVRQLLPAWWQIAR